MATGIPFSLTRGSHSSLQIIRHVMEPSCEARSHALDNHQRRLRDVGIRTHIVTLRIDTGSQRNRSLCGIVAVCTERRRLVAEIECGLELHLQIDVKVPITTAWGQSSERTTAFAKWGLTSLGVDGGKQI